MRYDMFQRRILAFSAGSAVIVTALAVLLQLLVWHFIAQPVERVDLWCGKRYKPEDPAIDPGGATLAPSKSTVPLLDLQFRPRMSLYLATDTTGSFLIDTAISHIHGEPIKSGNGQPVSNGTLLQPSTGTNAQNTARSAPKLENDRLTLSATITRSDTGQKLLFNVQIPFDKTNNELQFPLTTFAPSKRPYKVSLTVVTPYGQAFEASTMLRHLPNPDSSNSVTKIDYLYGGLLARAAKTSTWESVFPYSFYVGGPWLREDPGNIEKLYDSGYNVLHIIPAGGLGYELPELDAWLNECDRIGMWIMLDMRWSYQVPKNIEILVEKVKGHGRLLLWYTADEPDGLTDPIGATKTAYDLINSFDGYHPVSLVLNCQNFYFQEYTSGADIILADPYPIGNNLGYSEVYKTPCNTTYGDCGCDNCFIIEPSPILNIKARYNDYQSYQEWLGLPRKPFWAVPQGFESQSFWKRDPSPEELIAITLFSIGAGTKGVVMWAWPTSPALAAVTKNFSKQVVSAATPFWLGSNVLRRPATENGVPSKTLDICGWVVGSQMLVTVANAGSTDISGEIGWLLPDGVHGKAFGQILILWGSEGWTLNGRDQLVKRGFAAVDNAVLIVDIVT